MKKVFTLAVIGLALTLKASADENGLALHTRPASCPPGCKIVEETTYQEVTRHVCKFTTETVKVKKWVYSCVDDPFCIPGSGRKVCGHDTCEADCPHCTGPLLRKQLVKREVVVGEVCKPKCVIEKVVDRVPCTVYRIVPCGEAVPTTVPPAAVQPTPDVEELKAIPKKL